MYWRCKWKTRETPPLHNNDFILHHCYTSFPLPSELTTSRSLPFGLVQLFSHFPSNYWLNFHKFLSNCLSHTQTHYTYIVNTNKTLLLENPFCFFFPQFMAHRFVPATNNSFFTLSNSSFMCDPHSFSTSQS